MRHPIWKFQYKDAHTLYHCESFYEIRIKFKYVHLDLYELYKYYTKPSTSLKIFCKNAPFKIIKALDQSCLQVTENLMQGCPSTANAIKMIIDITTLDEESRDRSQRSLICTNIGQYGVNNKNNKTHVIDRDDLHHRKRINFVSGHITANKSHD